MLAILLAALCAASLAAGAIAAFANAQLRQRTAVPQEEAPAVEEPPILSEPRRPARKSGNGRQPLLVAGLALIVVVYYFWSRRGGQVQSQRKCNAPPNAQQRLAFFGDLHGFHHDIQTDSDQAQALFDQGLLLAWNFNQPEAGAAFRLAAEADANASMAFWGLQYAVGPGANRAVLPERPPYPAYAPDNFPTCYQAARQALQLAEAAAAARPDSSAAQRDLAFARAAVARWPDGSEIGEARDAAEVAYADALKAYGEAHRDAAALAMAAEALLNLFPWDYYEGGRLKPPAAEAERLVIAALQIDSYNPLANHLLIHISEASSPLRDAPLSATRGLPAADRMTFEPGPWRAHQGHLLHMPSHTYVRTGRYNDAVTANVNAYNADLAFAEHCLFPYEPEHNTDMLIFAASMSGQAKVAEEFALRIREYPQFMFLEQPPGPSSNWAKLPLLLVHYARWHDVMALAKPGPGARANCPSGGGEFALTIWRYVRALAAAARTEGARQEGDDAAFRELDGYLDDYLRALREAQEAVQPEPPVLPPAVYMCEHEGLAQVYLLTAEARVAFLRGQIKAAVEKLEKAVAIEDGFAYMEPPRVYQPVRQCLGHVLLASGQLEAAEKVYRADLEAFPENGWSLQGLSAALHELGRHEEVDALRPRLQAAWRHADTAVDSSCLAFSRAWRPPAPDK